MWLYNKYIKEVEAIGDTNACCAIAYSVLTKSTIINSNRILNRKRGEGVLAHVLNQALNRKGLVLTPVNVRGLARSLPKRLDRNHVYLVYYNSHVSVITYGVFQDWISDKNTRNKRAEIVYRVDGAVI